jgi:polyketide synthase PksN
VVVLSARTAEQLKQQVRNLLAQVKSTPDLSMNDLSFTLFVGRMHLSHRLSCVARNQHELIRLLEQWVETGAANQISTSALHESTIREPVSLKTVGNYCIQECRNATDAASYLEYLAAIAELYVQGYSLDFQALFSRDSRRIPLPTYPFAQERYWIDTVDAARPRSTAAATAALHPLLHTNTSNLSQQSFSTTFTGLEFFLKDHQLATHGHDTQKVLPEVAYLEMARVAVEHAASIVQGSAVLELRDTVWAHPIVVNDHKQVTIALFANDNEQIDYEIYSAEAEQDIIHCQGRAVVSHQPAPAPLRIDELRGQMSHGKLAPNSIYAAFSKMGIHYGPANQAITAIDRGDKQLLARLSLPAATNEAGGGQDGYILHPSVMSGALQAGIGLIADSNQLPDRPLSPSALECLRIISACTGEMFAWARFSLGSLPGDKLIKLDIDLVDTQGSVCVQIRGLSFQIDDAVIEAPIQPAWLFSREQPSVAGDTAAHIVSMGPEETMALFLRQETAIQLQRPVDEIPTDLSYFDLGLSSLAIANLIQNTNRLLDEDLSPSVLFEYRDIQSLAAYLAATYPSKIDAVIAIKRIGPQAYSREQRHSHPLHLTPLPRKKYFPASLAGSSVEHTNATTSEAEMSPERVLANVLWQEASLDDSYEKVTF